MNARQRVLTRLTLAGPMREDPGQLTDGRSVALRVDVTSVGIERAGIDEAGRPAEVALDEYWAARPDPLHAGAAEQLQHLAAQHPEAISTLSRLCDTEAMIGVVRVLPIALDRYGIVLRVERNRDHRDVRLPFQARIDSGAAAAFELRHLLHQAQRRRPCGR